MNLALTRHPDTPCAAVESITVDVARSGPGRLAFRYTLTGSIGDLLMPPVVGPTRAEELWKHTCLEAFLRPARNEWYAEFNFSPSKQWAAYRFQRYREGMEHLRQPPPRIDVRSTECQYEMSVVDVATGILPGQPRWLLGLSAVIEETNGRKSCWALAHPPGKPDFHHADGFVFELPAAETA